MSALAEAAAAGALDLHEGIGDPRLSGCLRWPELLWLRSSQGELVRGRCGATNLCRYCQALYVVETLEMLWLDAAEYAPELWAVLTAREHLTRAQLRDHLRQIRRAAKLRWPAIEWFVQVEFQRRGALHANLLVKGVAVVEDQELHELLCRVWCDRVDAEPVGQWVGRIADAGSVTRYLQKTLAHGLKQEQAPPIGWRGHRTSQTRGYLVRPASVMREEARRSLRHKRELWRALQRGLSGQGAEDAALQAVAASEATTWELWRQAPAPVEPKAGLAGVPVAVLEDAWRWQDERDLIAHGRLEAGQSHPPGALSAPRAV